MPRDRPKGSLRGRAEARLARRPAPPSPIDLAEAERTLHELQVQQVELQLQNEELVGGRATAEQGLSRYTRLFEHAPIGYVLLDGEGNVRDSNFVLARLIGTERGQLVGSRFLAFIVMEERAAFLEMNRRLFGSAEGGRESCEADMDTAAGRRTVRFTATVLDRAPTILVACEDITDRVRAEAAMRAEVALRAENRQKDEFLAALSHELRNPLAPIRTSLYVLEHSTGAGGEENARRARAIIQRQVDHLSRIVDDLLDVTRIARGKIHLQQERIELGELVRSTVDDHRQSFEAAGLRLCDHFDSRPLWIDGDVTRLAQVLANLLGNAIKFTPQGGEVDVGLQSERGTAVLSVHDNGTGVAPEVRGRLFEPFMQAPQSLERSHGGLGLGLAMVKGLVELHGGSVDVVSAGLGKGATFTVRLPLKKAPKATPPPPSTTGSVALDPDHRRPARRGRLARAGLEAEGPRRAGRL
jgi:PAS domain S-box-containing protein